MKPNRVQEDGAPLPPMCNFCIRCHASGGGNDLSCDAFERVPDAVAQGRHDHRGPFPSDGGVRFLLDPEMAVEFFKIMAMRRRLLRIQSVKAADRVADRDDASPRKWSCGR